MDALYQSAKNFVENLYYETKTWYANWREKPKIDIDLNLYSSTSSSPEKNLDEYWDLNKYERFDFIIEKPKEGFFKK